MYLLLIKTICLGSQGMTGRITNLMEGPRVLPEYTDLQTAQITEGNGSYGGWVFGIKGSPKAAANTLLVFIISLHFLFKFPPFSSVLGLPLSVSVWLWLFVVCSLPLGSWVHFPQQPFCGCACHPRSEFQWCPQGQKGWGPLPRVM